MSGVRLKASQAASRETLCGHCSPPLHWGSMGLGHLSQDGVQVHCLGLFLYHIFRHEVCESQNMLRETDPSQGSCKDPATF